jgi:hypothetical protein
MVLIVTIRVLILPPLTAGLVEAISVQLLILTSLPHDGSGPWSVHVRLIHVSSRVLVVKPHALHVLSDLVYSIGARGTRRRGLWGLRRPGWRAVVRAPVLLAILLLTVVWRPIAIRLVAKIWRMSRRVLMPGLLLLRLSHQEGRRVTLLPGAFIPLMVRGRCIMGFAVACKAHSISQYGVGESIVVDSLLEVWLQASVEDGKRYVILRQTQVSAEHIQPLCKLAD